MTRVFVLTNHKGGIGESTSATNIDFGITQVLHRAEVPNARVRLIDTDSQGHATRVTTVHNDYGAHGSLYTVLMADRQAIPYLRAQRSPLDMGGDGRYEVEQEQRRQICTNGNRHESPCEDHSSVAWRLISIPTTYAKSAESITDQMTGNASFPMVIARIRVG